MMKKILQIWFIFFSLGSIWSQEYIVQTPNDYEAQQNYLKEKLREAIYILQELESSTLNSLNYIISETETKQTKNIQEYYTTYNTLKNNPSYSDIPTRSCLHQELQEAEKLYKEARLQQCLPNKKQLKILKRTKSRISMLEKSVEDITKYCKYHIYYGQMEICIKRRVNNIYHQIFYIEFEFTNELNNIMLKSEKCTNSVTESLTKTMNFISKQTEACVYSTN